MKTKVTIYTKQGIFRKMEDECWYDENNIEIDFLKVTYMEWHRLDGPASVRHFKKSHPINGNYYINDTHYNKEDYYKQPEVLEHLKQKEFDKTLTEILMEDQCDTD